MLERVRGALPMAAIHLFLGGVILSFVAGLIFLVWFPYPFREVTNGTTLFLLLSGVDLVCGPLLTLLLYDKRKKKWQWYVDVLIISSVQISALIYGLTGIVNSRPVFVAFEGDRFRVVSAADVDKTQLAEAPSGLQQLSWTGPRLLGVKLLETNDPNFLDSLRRALNGDHPSFRPTRWQHYSQVTNEVSITAKELSGLADGGSDFVRRIELDLGKTAASLGYLPLVQDATTDWIVVVDRERGMPVAYYHKDGWQR